jgi:CubicO group peptidase (beta-lactamase class C family)
MISRDEIFDTKFGWVNMKTIVFIIFIIFSTITACFAHGQQNKNNLSCIINQAMIRYKVPAASLAIINHNQITLVRVYKNPNYPKLRITTNTMFQAASMSKSVVAFAALRLLIQQKKLTLDGNVNTLLKTWKTPKNKFTRKNSVTVRNIVSMTSGLSVHGFAGYSVGAKLPSLVQILNGQSPANSPPIRVTFVPGTKYLYSGGGYLVLQQLMTDVTNKSFPLEMQHLVLRPLDMKNSLFARSLDKELRLQAIPGFYSMADNHGAMVEGGWHNYPELGAGGLWTTPKDLAKFVINIIKSYRGKKEGLLRQGMAKKMLTRQKNSVFGLGVIVNGKGRNLNFGKGGRTLGYTSLMIGFPNTGQGAILMINSNSNLPFIQKVMKAIGRIYKWPSMHDVHINNYKKNIEEQFILTSLNNNRKCND